MKTQKFSVQLFVVFFITILLLNISPILGMPGAVWTTDATGETQDGNRYYDPEDVFLNARLKDGIYYFLVTDMQDNNLSSDSNLDRRLWVDNGIIVNSTHYNVTINGAVVVQLWPFESSDRGYKVWVSSTPDFLPKYSKTDNFHVIQDLIISVRKMEDITGDGLSSDDTPLEGWNVQLWKDGSLYGSEETDSEGWFNWTNLEPASYEVSEETPTGWTATSDTHHDFGALESGYTYTHTFTNFENVDVTAEKFEDFDGDGGADVPIEGWMVHLTIDDVVVDTQLTGADGSYTWTDLGPLPMGNQYGISETFDEVEWTATSLTSFNFGQPLSGASYSDTFTNFENVDVTANKYEDFDGDGDADSPIEGWEVHLTIDGVIDDTQYTNASGKYTWTNLGPLPAGSYYGISETVTAGWTATRSTSVNFESPPQSGAKYSDIFTNFKNAKFFELFVTDGVQSLSDAEFFVNYTIDGTGVWECEALSFDRGDFVHSVFQHKASFSIGTVIEWKFKITYTDHLGIPTTWESETKNETIDQMVMVNKGTVFLVDGVKYDSSDVVVQDAIAKLYDYDNDPLMMNTLGKTQTNASGYFALIAAGPGHYTVSCEAWDSNSETFYWTLDECVIDQTFVFRDAELAEIKLKLKGTEITDDFDVVFTPDKKGDGYKLSSTNMGSFHFYTIKFGNPGEEFKLEIILPPDFANIDPVTGEPAEYDEPNFIFAHPNKGEIDVHVYKGTTESHTADITNAFDITTDSEEYDPDKYVKVNGTIPEDCNSVLIKVHLQFDIDATLTAEQVEDFHDFEYWFTVIHNPRGVRSVRGVR